MGIVLTHSSEEEILGMNETQCIYTEVLSDYEYTLTNNTIQTLLESNMTQEDIDSYLDEINALAEDAAFEMTCKFNYTETLKTMFELSKAGNSSSTVSCSLDGNTTACNSPEFLEGIECEFS